MKKKDRIWEIDFLRGFAIIMMIFDHIMFDLAYVFSLSQEVTRVARAYMVWEPRLVLQQVFVLIFILVSGISSSFSRNNFFRGLKLFLFALALSAVTYFLGEGYFILFGVLHMLAVSMLLYALIQKWKDWAVLLLGGVLMAGAVYVRVQGVELSYNVFHYILGLSRNVPAGDYFPLMPWCGVFMIGAVLGRWIYRQKKSLFSFTPKWQKPFAFVGRHSLLVYLAHQPLVWLILFGICYLLGRPVPFF